MTEILSIAYITCTFALTLGLAGLLAWGLWAWLMWVFPVENDETKRTLFGAIYLPIVWVGIAAWLIYVALA